MKNICYASVMVQSSKLFCKESTTLHTFTPTYLKSLNIPIGLWTQPPSANFVLTPQYTFQTINSTALFGNLQESFQSFSFFLFRFAVEQRMQTFGRYTKLHPEK